MSRGYRNDVPHAFIEPDSTAAVRGQCLLYPSAGGDCTEVLTAFAADILEFRFADIGYDFSHQRCLEFPNETGWELVSTELTGSPTATIEQRYTETGRRYRQLDPARLTQIYERRDAFHRIKVVWRRGFGQYALAEIPDRSLGVFVHRGDSRGEGGSNVFYLANRRKHHEPCSNLFDKLKEKLSEMALIISDGSNADIPFLREFHHREIAGAQAFARMRERDFEYGGLRWRCVGYLGPRNGPTLVWRVTRGLPG